MTDPDMGYWTYQYDANGNLSSQTDARIYTIVFSYDALNRLTSKHYPTGPDVVYTYDELTSTNPKGRLTTVSDASGTTKYYYDMLGRTTRTVRNVDGVEYTTDSTYDALGRTTGITSPDPGRETVSYTYDTGGNLSTVAGYATYSNYNALGQAGLVTNGNGDTTTYQFHAWNNRLYTTTRPRYGLLGTLNNVTDAAGNMTRIGYDTLSRKNRGGRYFPMFTVCFLGKISEWKRSHSAEGGSTRNCSPHCRFSHRRWNRYAGSRTRKEPVSLVSSSLAGS